jgi:hypothetical protein
VQNSILNRMMIFSDQVAHQKTALYLEILIFRDFFAKYSASRFAILSELSLKAIELDVELNSAPNDTIFDYSHQAKPFHPQHSILPSMTLCPYPHRNFLPGNPGQK